MNNGINLSDPTPLYLQVERDIISQIESGKLKADEQIGSHQQLSKKYNVSLITIKKALSNLTRSGVLYARVGKGTYVAEKKSSVSDLSEHKTIGLVLRDLKHPFFSLIVHSIEQRAYELGFTLLLSSSSGNVEKEEGQIEHFRKMGVDGLIIASLSLEYRATDYIQRLHKEGFPYIMVSYMHDSDYWYVGSDHELGSFMATEHLIKLGYESVGYVHVGEGNLLSEVRKRGYSRALKENNMPIEEDNIFTLSHKNQISGLDRFKLGYEFGLRFIDLKKKNRALVLYSDSLAMGFMKACTERDVKVPDDIAIVGFDDIEIARHASTPLTTIRQDHNEIGSRAVDIIQKRLKGIKENNRIILKPTLIIRESCGSKLKTRHNLSSKKEVTPS
jgi:DNA-binding LacI/PurR family transcriptional regulator